MKIQKKQIKIKKLKSLLIDKFYLYLTNSNKQNSISMLDIELAKILFK